MYMSIIKIERTEILRYLDIQEIAPISDFNRFSDINNSTIVVHKASAASVHKPFIRNLCRSKLELSGPIYLTPQTGQTLFEFPSSCEFPNLNISRIEKVICCPGQIALLTDSLSNPSVSRSGILGPSLSDQWSRGSVSVEKIDQDRFQLRTSIENPPELNGRFLYLDCMHGAHFGHFIVDILSMVWAFSFLRDFGFHDLKVLVSQPILPYMEDMLASHGIYPADITRIEQPFRCQEVFFATRSYFTQGYTSPTAIDTWKKVRDFFDSGNGIDRVYFSRRKNFNRSLTNEHLVEQIFRDHGFTIVYPEELKIDEQVNIWANARLIAGTAGSNMYGLAFQKKLRASFIVNSPNFIHLQEMFLQSGHDSKTDIYLGQSDNEDIHGEWFVAPDDLEFHLEDWMSSMGEGRQCVSVAARKAHPRIIVKPMGGFANQMIQFLAASALATSCGTIELEGIKLPEWDIRFDQLKELIGRTVRFGDQINLLNIDGLTSCLNRDMLDTVFIDSYAQHFANFPPVSVARTLFITPSAFDDVRGFGNDRLVISVRGGEILDGRHPDYFLLPPSFYETVIATTGLKPVFFGQIEDNAYCLALRARFPKAEFVAGRGTMHDFAVLRRSQHIVPSISTFSWLAAWLSEAETVFMPVAGLFNPRQARAHNFLPLDDPRYRFYLFPLAYSTDILNDPQRFAAMQKALDGKARLVTADRLREITAAPPLVKRRLDAFLRFYDEDYYMESQSDIGASVRAGHLPSALHHYMHHGFAEERGCFRIDNFHYATEYPIAAMEVAQGEYLDFAHHFVEVGWRRGYSPK